MRDRLFTESIVLYVRKGNCFRERILDTLNDHSLLRMNKSLSSMDIHSHEHILNILNDH
jgi:hypothetical protein